MDHLLGVCITRSNSLRLLHFACVYVCVLPQNQVQMIEYIIPVSVAILTGFVTFIAGKDLFYRGRLANVTNSGLVAILATIISALATGGGVWFSNLSATNLAQGTIATLQQSLKTERAESENYQYELGYLNRDSVISNADAEAAGLESSARDRFVIETTAEFIYQHALDEEHVARLAGVVKELSSTASYFTMGNTFSSASLQSKKMYLEKSVFDFLIKLRYELRANRVLARNDSAYKIIDSTYTLIGELGQTILLYNNYSLLDAKNSITTLSTYCKESMIDFLDSTQKILKPMSTITKLRKSFKNDQLDFL